VYLLELAGEDDRFALREAATATSQVRPLAAGLAIARGVERAADIDAATLATDETVRTGAADACDGAGRLALTRRVSRLVGVADGTPADALRLLDAAPNPAPPGTATVAVRARDVRSTTGVDTRAVERRLGDALVERGHRVDLDDPDHELRALFSRPDRWADPDVGTADVDVTDRQSPPGARLADVSGPSPDEDRETVCALGWLDAEMPRDFAPPPTERPFFQPGSMAPQLARALANLAGARPGRRLLDPMCGTGGLLVEAGLVGARPFGVDARERMARGAAENLRTYADGETLVGDAARLPLRDDAVDGVVLDVPYGRQSAIRGGDLRALVADALAEARRVAPRAVAVGDREWTAVAREAGWTVDTLLRLRVHRSLVRHVHVLVTTETSR